MQPIKDLLNQIKWDKRKNPDDYVIFYLDRILSELIEIPYNYIKRLEGNSIIIKRKGREIYIPMHRIKIVKKNGLTVWKR